MIIDAKQLETDMDIMRRSLPNENEPWEAWDRIAEILRRALIIEENRPRETPCNARTE